MMASCPPQNVVTAHGENKPPFCDSVHFATTACVPDGFFTFTAPRVPSLARATRPAVSFLPGGGAFYSQPRPHGSPSTNRGAVSAVEAPQAIQGGAA